MVFQTERLTVKAIEKIHENEFIELLTAEEIINAIPQERPSEENVAMKFQIALSFDGNIKGNSISLLGVFEKNKNELIGLAGFLTNEEEERELGYRFRKDFWGIGYASEITKEMINYSFSVLNFEKITADVWIENIPSNKVLSKFLN
ncbi:GNAT family N-acetyltransferase [uncultured Tenacibaculum sp.]|uniref:GNAT family N-acetyltransferase n=1 Tax=uncultured Tenacibaculum sp. TaxID=174713 RepID=UPI00260271B7|nr:GNAT family N-acetyltransferase [uncultured Tenacibaculum sp.]